MDEIQWEIGDGEGARGSFTEAALVVAIERGLPATTLVRPVGKEKWKPVGAHVPFAQALARAAARPLPPPQIPPAPAPFAHTPPMYPFPQPFRQPALVRAPPTPLISKPILIAAICTLVLGLAVMLGARTSGPSAERRAAMEEAAAKDRAFARQQQEEVEARAARQKEAEARAAHRQAVATYANMTPAGREKALRDACEAGCEPAVRGPIIEGAADGAERDKLRGILEKLQATSGAKRREAFADALEKAYLEKHLNPDGVSAAGPEKTKLVIRAWFCTRQFVHDFTDATGDKLPDGKLAADVGFKKYECIGPAETWSGDL